MLSVMQKTGVTLFLLVGFSMGLARAQSSAMLLGVSAYFEEQVPDAAAKNFVLTPLGGGTFQGLIDPPFDPLDAFVITGGMTGLSGDGFRITTVDHTPWYQPVLTVLCQAIDVFCPSIAVPIPPDILFKVWLYEDGNLVLENSYTDFGEQYDAGHYVDVLYTFEDGHRYTVLAGYQSDQCASPPCIDTAARLYWQMPDVMEQDTYYKQETYVEDWPEDWTTGGSFDGLAPPRVSFFYESRPLVPVLDAASEWAEWPASSGQWATNHGSTLLLQDSGYVNVTWTLTHAQDFEYSQTLSASGGDPYPIELPDLSQHPTLAGVDSGFSLELLVENGYGLVDTTTYTLSSFRPLRFDTISWNIHYENLGQGSANKYQYGLLTQREVRSTEDSCYAPDQNRDQDISFEIDQWGPSVENLMPPASDYSFRASLLCNARDSNNSNRVATATGNTGSGMKMTLYDFRNSYSWYVYRDGSSGGEYDPGGYFVELGLSRVTDERSGNLRTGPEGEFPDAGTWTHGESWQEHRLRLFQVFPIQESPCAAPRSITFQQSGSGGTATQYSFTPGTDLPIWFLPQFDLQFYHPGTPDRIDYIRLTFSQDGQELAVPLITHPWSTCIGGSNPALYPGQIETIVLPGDLPLEGTGISLKIEARNKRNNSQGSCDDIPSVFSASIPIVVGTAPAPVTLNSFGLVISGVTPQIDTETGGVNFEFCAQPSEQAPTTTFLEWRWYREVSGATHYWYNGQWSGNDSFHKVGPGSTDPFSLNWTWQGNTGDCDLTAASAPFVVPNQVTGFFDSGPQQSIFVEARLRYDATTVSDSLVVSDAPFTVEAYTEPLPTIDLNTLEASVASGPWSGQQVTYTEGEVDTLSLRILTDDEEDNGLLFADVSFNLTDRNGAVLMSCQETLDSFDVSWVGTEFPRYYSLAIKNPGTLRDILDQPGQYQLQILPQLGTCGTPVNRLSVDLNVNPAVTEPESRLLVRLHFRDHLGSSMVSKAFRVVVPDAGAQGTATVTLNGMPVTLHGHDPEYSFYEPFGERLDVDGSATDDARYTDHELDGFSGLNYMKGRFQLATLAKFNRPDPMRDWNWLVPHTINLYEYVGNDPVNQWDPTGLYKFKSTGNADLDARYQAQFESALQANLKRDGEIAEAALAYGEKGAEGVTVVFATPSGKDLDGDQGSNFSLVSDDKGNVSLNMESTITISPKRVDEGGTTLEAIVAHEGSHQKDDNAVLASFDAESITIDAKVVITKGESERRAYRVTHQVFTIATEVFSQEVKRNKVKLGFGVVQTEAEQNIKKIINGPSHREVAEELKNPELTSIDQRKK